MEVLATKFDAAVVGRNNRAVTLHGMVHALRDLGGVTFLTLRTREGLVQCVCPRRPEGVREECAVSVSGVLRPEPRAPGGAELAEARFTVLSRPAAPPPVPLSKKSSVSLDTELSLRPVTLRAPRARAVFRIQAAVCRAFREFLQGEGFTEIHTPKLGRAGAEGGSSQFRLDYFGRKAVLAQSPQLYKQAMVGVFERVYEIGPVFRAEKHATQRHLNEYTSLDLEMGFLHSFTDLMALEQGFLRRLVALLRQEYAGELALLGAELPDAEHIPAVRFDEAKRLAAEAYGYAIREPYDLEPEEEQHIGRYAKEVWGSDFVFVTHYPGRKRPFYTMDDPEDPRYTLSFDLLFRGMEITTGGQRIHNYGQQVEKLKARGMEPEDFSGYLLFHKHGAPPHGGLGIGLERLTMQLCGLDNIRRASLFPRDRTRLEP
ncbi:aspartate--tRNA(Asn) ligase [Flavonifractor plautii]|uniref:Aspartate--tRNA(Asp/Asn) ligase n=1 Tax=Flavonifractor plautii ATCC 29863 TaxID=411475 RepID=G9YP88_FLAPL|nr:aspartate--tRNA(Asn) ligase [Flavonifractor plautii]EHM52880.1 aspartate--tRNA ligase [Flavonifractor plautii ATCC 29863]QIA30504.1 aspartate--tRNA(Asn) ligase [Flavonifractor plautii]